MSTYEIDPDALFSDSDDGSPRDDTPVSASPLKRPRVTQPPNRRPPSLGTIRLTFPPKSMLNSANTSATSQQTSSYGSTWGSTSSASAATTATAAASTSRSQVSSFSQPLPSYAPPRQNYNRPRPDGYSRPPFGRGRGATLPAHLTRSDAGPHNDRSQNHRPPYGRSSNHDYNGRRPTPHYSSEPDVKSTATVDEILLKSAASILPLEEREQVLNESKNRVVEQRKRPGVSIRKHSSTRSIRSSVVEQREKSVIMKNVLRAQNSATKFQGLESLLKTAQRTAGEGLIRLDRSGSSEKSRSNRKRKQPSDWNIYAEVTMSKEMREREERERREEERRAEEERMAVIEHYRRKRDSEREERRRLCMEWKQVETVAAAMRDCHRLERIERRLFEAENDRHKRDSLSYLGLKLKPSGEDAQSTVMFTVEVVEI